MWGILSWQFFVLYGFWYVDYFQHVLGFVPPKRPIATICYQYVLSFGQNVRLALIADMKSAKQLGASP